MKTDKKRFRVLKGVLCGVAALALSAAVQAAPTITFVGNDNSTGNWYSQGDVSSWGTSVDSGKKAAWRSTSTDPKAYVLEGHQNVYGADGYVFFGTSNKSQDSDGTLNTGTRSDRTFSGITSYISALEVIGGQIDNNDNAATLDDPTAAIQAVCPRTIVAGRIAFNFKDDESTQAVARITFSENVTEHPKVRLAVLSNFGDGHNPAAIIVGETVGEVVDAGSAYGLHNWHFFDIDGAAAGDTLEIKVVYNPNARWGRSAVLSAFTFDSISTIVNQKPVITSAEAADDEVEFANWSASTTLSATATDADGDTLTYVWSVDGPQPGAVEFSGGDADTATVTMKAVGTYTLRVDVSDGIDIVSSNVSVRVIAKAGEGSAEFVGCEKMTSGETYVPCENPADFAWGAADGGCKNSFRSLATSTKNFLLKGKPNAYGTDGYMFLGKCVNLAGEEIGDVHSGSANEDGSVISGVTDYASFELNTGREYTGRFGGGYWMDDPREAISDWVADFRPGTVNVDSQYADYGKFGTLVFNQRVARHPVVRIGIMSSYGEGWKPTSVRVGGTSADWIGDKAYGRADWMFFDIKGAKPGDRVDIEVKGVNMWGKTVRVEGIVFDSIEKKGMEVIIK